MATKIVALPEQCNLAAINLMLQVYTQELVFPVVSSDMVYVFSDTYWDETVSRKHIGCIKFVNTSFCWVLCHVRCLNKCWPPSSANAIRSRAMSVNDTGGFSPCVSGSTLALRLGPRVQQETTDCWVPRLWILVCDSICRFSMKSLSGYVMLRGSHLSPHTRISFGKYLFIIVKIVKISYFDKLHKSLFHSSSGKSIDTLRFGSSSSSLILHPGRHTHDVYLTTDAAVLCYRSGETDRCSYS